MILIHCNGNNISHYNSHVIVSRGFLPLAMIDTTSISGNAPNDVKVFISQMFDGSKEANFAKGFARDIAKLLVFEEISVNKNPEEPAKLDGRVVCRVVVDDGLSIITFKVSVQKVGYIVFLNAGASVHGGCIAFLVLLVRSDSQRILIRQQIDICSTLALMAQTMVATGTPLMSVSQSLNIVYHSPAVKGDELRIVNSTVSVGSRVLTVRTEVSCRCQ